MELRNISRRSTEELRQLAEFVGGMCRVSGEKATIKVRPQYANNVTDGEAFFKDSIIEICISYGLSYPLYDPPFKKGMPAVVWQSWQEEFLFVLAHEMRHIDQNWSYRHRTSREAELDAEVFAHSVLQQYRRRQRMAA